MVINSVLGMSSIQGKKIILKPAGHPRPTVSDTFSFSSSIKDSPPWPECPESRTQEKQIDKILRWIFLQGVNEYRFLKTVPVIRNFWDKVRCDHFEVGHPSCSEYGQTVLEDPDLTLDQQLSLILRRLKSCGNPSEKQLAVETKNLETSKAILRNPNLIGQKQYEH